mmetsp:Transcript_31849/g.48131  ORF Transcript_31849/g.48131 Transcript_31849/m.48131 type:complete len:80 (-) Transcript_31849:47-286(-)
MKSKHASFWPRSIQINQCQKSKTTDPLSMFDEDDFKDFEVFCETHDIDPTLGDRVIYDLPSPTYSPSSADSIAANLYGI